VQNHPVRRDDLRVKPVASHIETASRPSCEQLGHARRVGRPATGNTKQLIAIRIAAWLLAQLRRLAAKQSKPYQTLIHELREPAAEKKVA
jgi:uncharacterized protein (DUF4415 family)